MEFFLSGWDNIRITWQTNTCGVLVGPEVRAVLVFQEPVSRTFNHITNKSEEVQESRDCKGEKYNRIALSSVIGAVPRITFPVYDTTRVLWMLQLGFPGWGVEMITNQRYSG